MPQQKPSHNRGKRQGFGRKGSLRCHNTHGNTRRNLDSKLLALNFCSGAQEPQTYVVRLYHDLPKGKIRASCLKNKPWGRVPGEINHFSIGKTLGNLPQCPGAATHRVLMLSSRNPVAGSKTHPGNCGETKRRGTRL